MAAPMATGRKGEGAGVIKASEGSVQADMAAHLAKTARSRPPSFPARSPPEAASNEPLHTPVLPLAQTRIGSSKLSLAATASAAA